MAELPDDFVRDYLSLIESFRKANPRCKVWVCRMIRYLTAILVLNPVQETGTGWSKRLSKKSPG